MYLKALVVSCLCAGVLSQSTGQSENNGATAVKKNKYVANTSEENGGKMNSNEGRKRKKKEKRTDTEQSSSKLETDSTNVAKEDSKPQDVAKPKEENSGQVAGNEVKVKRKRKDKDAESKNTNTGETEQVAPPAQAEQKPNAIPQNTEELEPSINLYKPLFYMFFISLGLFLFYFFGIKRLNGNPPVSIEKTPLYTHIEDAETGNRGRFFTLHILAQKMLLRKIWQIIIIISTIPMIHLITINMSSLFIVISVHVFVYINIHIFVLCITR
jgi:hypothetical protein